MNEYLFMIIIVTNPKCQITQSRIDNNLENSDLETSDLENSDLKTSDLETSAPLKNGLNCKHSST